MIVKRYKKTETSNIIRSRTTLSINEIIHDAEAIFSNPMLEMGIQYYWMTDRNLIGKENYRSSLVFRAQFNESQRPIIDALCSYLKSKEKKYPYVQLRISERFNQYSSSYCGEVEIYQHHDVDRQTQLMNRVSSEPLQDFPTYINSIVSLIYKEFNNSIKEFTAEYGDEQFCDIAHLRLCENRLIDSEKIAKNIMLKLPLVSLYRNTDNDTFDDAFKRANLMRKLFDRPYLHNEALENIYQNYIIMHWEEYYDADHSCAQDTLYCHINLMKMEADFNDGVRF